MNGLDRLGSGRAARKAFGGKNHSRHQRVSLPDTVILGRDLHVRDISEGGLGLPSPRALPIGGVIRATLPLDGNRKVR